MRQVNRLAHRARNVLRRPPPPRWRKPALWAAAVILILGTLGGGAWYAVASGRVAAADGTTSWPWRCDPRLPWASW